MKVMLPGTFSGEKIVAAFEKAGTLQIQSGEELITETKVHEVKVEPGSVKFVDTIKSVTSRLWRFEYEYRFWGRDDMTGKLCFYSEKKKGWCSGPDKHDDYAEISLKPLVVQDKFTEVKIDFRVGFPCETFIGKKLVGRWSHVSDPTDEDFNTIAKPFLEPFLERFFAELGAQPAQS